MKVFLFSKVNTKEDRNREEKLLQRETEIEKLRISEKSSVKNLIISNPKRSSSLYIIHGLRLFHKSKAYKNLNGVSLYCNNYMKSFHEDDHIFDENINPSVHDKGNKKLRVCLNDMQNHNISSMQLKDIRIEKSDKDHLELLNNEFLIILPGGKIGVEFKDNLEEIDGEITVEKKKI